jgi:hypothetical protein
MRRLAGLAPCGTITGAVAETTSTWPPISALTDSPDERNGAMVSLVDATPATLQRLGDGQVRVLAQRGATAMRSRVGSRLQRGHQVAAVLQGRVGAHGHQRGLLDQHRHRHELCAGRP